MTHIYRTFLGKKQYIGDYCSYSDVIVHSLGMLLEVYGICDLDLRSKGQTPWPTQKVKTHWHTFWFSGSSMPATWSRTFTFSTM